MVSENLGRLRFLRICLLHGEAMSTKVGHRGLHVGQFVLEPFYSESLAFFGCLHFAICA